MTPDRNNGHLRVGNDSLAEYRYFSASWGVLISIPFLQNMQGGVLSRAYRSTTKRTGFLDAQGHIFTTTAQICWGAQANDSSHPESHSQRHSHHVVDRRNSDEAEGCRRGIALSPCPPTQAWHARDDLESTRLNRRGAGPGVSARVGGAVSLGEGNRCSGWGTASQAVPLHSIKLGDHFRSGSRAM